MRPPLRDSAYICFFPVTNPVIPKHHVVAAWLDMGKLDGLEIHFPMELIPWKHAREV